MLDIEHIINDGFLTHMVAFHSQQAIEKTLKAVLFEFENTSPKIHAIDTLFAKTVTYIELRQNQHLIDELDKLYIDSRYPGDFGLLPDGKPSLEDAREFYEFAKEVYEETNKEINKNSDEC